MQATVARIPHLPEPSMKIDFRGIAPASTFGFETMCVPSPRPRYYSVWSFSFWIRRRGFSISVFFGAGPHPCLDDVMDPRGIDAWTYNRMEGLLPYNATEEILDSGKKS